MQEITDKKTCSGCHACYSICPKKCINMQVDDEGFWYPVINQDKCINCELCKKVCPILNEHKGNKGKAYACINKDEFIRMQSSSGGVFTLIAENIIEEGGVVFGAAFDDELNVFHTAVKSKSDLERFRGSKYLQSNIGDTYKEAKIYLEADRKVLFTGTPCQISGLKSFLGKEYNNLITQDFICHGVPSPMVWQRYLQYLSKVYGGNIDKNDLPDLRSKNSGWTNYSIKINFNNGKKHIKNYLEDSYMQAFLNNLCLRESCYNCYSKSLERESDITLADFWGIQNVLPEMFDDKGTSLVFINSSKGNRLFNEIADKMIYKNVDIDEAVKYNCSAYKSCERNNKRNKFMSRISKENFGKLVNKSTRQGIVKKYINILKRTIRKVRKNV